VYKYLHNLNKLRKNNKFYRINAGTLDSRVCSTERSFTIFNNGFSYSKITAYNTHAKQNSRVK